MADDVTQFLTTPDSEEGKALTVPADPGPVPTATGYNTTVLNVEDTSPDSGYVTEAQNAMPYVVEPGSALTIGKNKGPGVEPGFIQGRTAGRYIPDFESDLKNDEVPEATKAAVKAVQESTDKQTLSGETVASNKTDSKQ